MKKDVIVFIWLVLVVPASGQLKLLQVDPEDIGKSAQDWPAYSDWIDYSGGGGAVSVVPLEPLRAGHWRVLTLGPPDGPPVEVGFQVWDLIPLDPPGSENVKVADVYVGADHFDVVMDYGYYTRVTTTQGGAAGGGLSGDGEWLIEHDWPIPMPTVPMIVADVGTSARSGYEYLGLSGKAVDMGFAWGTPLPAPGVDGAFVWLDMDDYFAAVPEQAYIKGIFGFPVEPGTNVEAVLSRTLGLEFEEITSPGHVIWDYISGPELPAGFQLGGSGRFYDITTTAEFSGWVEVGIGYNPTRFTIPEEMLQLYHYDSGSWYDVTTNIDTLNNIIYGRVDSLSPFAVVENVAVIPAPGAILLGSIGIACLSWLRRRRTL